ncbi:hypothetical protein PROFUN_06602 [Planoprotostelium fungivorum]|uniref:Uncharacterized protein n=2 Tax=Planoprotostelium fungivorum TaxID=1890364 RepID=A0A2P6MS04_9EUKA|nr:hypothetical protein PROFUN_06602 [Planoprotostelium fungivorum]
MRNFLLLTPTHTLSSSRSALSRGSSSCSLFLLWISFGGPLSAALAKRLELSMKSWRSVESRLLRSVTRQEEPDIYILFLLERPHYRELTMRLKESGKELPTMMVEKMTSPNSVTASPSLRKSRGFSLSIFGNNSPKESYTPPYLSSVERPSVSPDEYEEMKWDLEESKKQLRIHMVKQLELEGTLGSLQSETALLRRQLEESSEKNHGELHGMKEKYKVTEEQLRGQIAHKVMEIVTLEGNLSSSKQEMDAACKRIQAQKEKIALVQKKYEVYKNKSMEDQKLLAKQENRIQNLTSSQKALQQKLDESGEKIKKLELTCSEREALARQREIESTELASRLKLQSTTSQMISRIIQGENSSSNISEEERQQLLNVQRVLETELETRSQAKVELEKKLYEVEHKYQSQIAELKNQLEYERNRADEAIQNVQNVADSYEDRIRRTKEDHQVELLTLETKLKTESTEELEKKNEENTNKQQVERTEWEQEKMDMEEEIKRLQAKELEAQEELKHSSETVMTVEEELQAIQTKWKDEEKRGEELQARNEKLASAINMLESAFKEEIMIKDEEVKAHLDEKRDLDAKIRFLDAEVVRLKLAAINSTQQRTFIGRSRSNTESSREGFRVLARSATSIAQEVTENVNHHAESAPTGSKTNGDNHVFQAPANVPPKRTIFRVKSSSAAFSHTQK